MATATLGRDVPNHGLEHRAPAPDTTRVLVAARLSRLVKGRDQVSIERQDHQAEAYAEAEPGRVIVKTTPDAGVSGSVSPFKRPELGPYLTRPELIESWDELVAAALDRLGRNARDLAALRAWCEDHGKKITVLSPRLTWPPADDDFASGMIWDVLARLAEIELRLTTKRYADTRAYLRERESLIGKPCWGFRIVGEKASKTLEPDPARLDYLNGMIDRAMSGKSLEAIAIWLDTEAERHPAARPRHGSRWTAKSVGNILRNPALAGRRMEKGSMALRHAGVINAERFARLQAKLDSNPKRRGPTRNAPMMLTDVIRCGRCGGPMHARRIPGRPRKDGTRYVWAGYRCDHTRTVAEDGTVTMARTSTCQNMVSADDVEQWVTDMMTRLNGDLEVIERTLVPADNHGTEIAEIDAELRALDFDADDYAERHAALMARRAHLRELGATPAHYEEHRTGETVAARWHRLDTAQRRDYLRRAGAVVYYTDEDAYMDVGDANKLRVA